MRIKGPLLDIVCTLLNEIHKIFNDYGVAGPTLPAGHWIDEVDRLKTADDFLPFFYAMLEKRIISLINSYPVSVKSYMLLDPDFLDFKFDLTGESNPVRFTEKQIRKEAIDLADSVLHCFELYWSSRFGTETFLSKYPKEVQERPFTMLYKQSLKPRTYKAVTNCCELFIKTFVGKYTMYQEYVPWTQKIPDLSRRK